MSASANARPPLRPIAIIGYSVQDEILCPSCLAVTTPITREKLEHICRRGPRPVPDAVRKRILALDAERTRPTRIAERLGVTLPTVMRVLSGDADDAPSCPACEASQRTDNREILPLYYGDTSVRDERCTYCGQGLVDVAVRRAAEQSPGFTVARVTFGSGYPGLVFDRRPPDAILAALKEAGWKARRSRNGWVWIDFSRTAEPPASLRLTREPGPPAARPPIIRRRLVGVEPVRH